METWSWTSSKRTELFCISFVLALLHGPLQACSLLKFFQHEPNGYPLSLSCSTLLRPCSKSDLLKVFDTVCSFSNAIQKTDGLVLDGSLISQMKRPTSQMKSFQDYLNAVKSYVVKKCGSYEHISVVFDVYIENSLKAATRQSRGKWMPMQVTLNGPLPSNWQNFLRVDSNK